MSRALLIGTLCLVLLGSQSGRAQSQRPLVLLGDQDYPPLSYLENGEPRGLDIDVARAVGRILGREVRITLMDWAAAQDAVRRGDADGLTDLSISEERRRLYEFADPTVTHDFGLFVRVGDTSTGGVNGLRGKTVGVTALGFPREFFERRPDVRLVIVANYEEGFDQLLAGSLDAVAADVWGGATTVERRGLTGVVLGGAPFASLPAAIAVRKGDTALLADINRAIQSLRADGTLQEIEDRWRPQQMVLLSRERVQNLVAWGVGAFLAVLLIATTVWALTLRKQVRARRTVEKRLTLLGHAFQSASDCIAITDPSRHIIYVNDAFLRTYEYEEREVLGQHIDIVRAKDKSPDVPDGVLSSGAIDDWRGEVWSRSKTGRVFPVSLVTSVVRDPQGEVTAVVGVARDITNEQLAEDALRSSEEKFYKVFHASPDFIAISDFDHGFLDVNDSFERITGYSRSEVLGRTMNDLGLFVDPLFRNAALERLRQRGTGSDTEYQLRRKNGEIATLSVSGATIEIGGRECFVTVHRDITERKRFETHLRQAAEVNKLLLSELDLEGLYIAIVESAHQILSLDYASLVMYDPNSRTLRLAAQRGALDAGRSPNAGQALASLAVERDEVRVLHRAELEALGESVRELLEVGLQSACCLPLTTARGTLGALIVGRFRPNAFHDDDITLLQQLATYVAIAIQNARSYEETRVLKDRLSLEKLYLEEEIRVDHNFADIVGDSPAIKRVLQQIETVAPTGASVLILGETGTGKELLARALHELSPRKDRTFVRMNVAALPATLLESELFGYERGAFTGATSNKVGRMELAHRGTLFLDEVGDIPLEVQPKLLRALQEREFERLGSTRTLHVDVRLIAATNRDLQRMVDEGTFRSDLFYRLNVFPLQVPPLRDRKEDIPLLVRYFVQKFAQRLKRQITSIPAATMSAFQAWHWPGNIRELENVIERAVIISSGEVLQVPTFQMKPVSDAGGLPRRQVPGTQSNSSSQPTFSTFAEGERNLILNALRDADGIIAGPTGAAARLGMKRTTLQSKMRKLGIRRPTF